MKKAISSSADGISSVPPTALTSYKKGRNKRPFRVRMDWNSAEPLFLDRRSNFCSEIGLFLLDTFAEREPQEGGDLRRSADLLLRILESLLDGNVGIEHEGLFQE